MLYFAQRRYFTQRRSGVMPILGPRNDEYPQDPDRGRRLRTARGAGRAARAARGVRIDRGRQWHQGGAGGQSRADRSRDHGCRAARRRRARGRAHPAQERLQGAHHHVDRTQYRFRYHPRARVRRQHEASEDAVFTIGPYTFRPSSKILLNPKGNKVRLTEKETAILRYLYRAGQRPVSRETLLQEVWGYNSGVTTHTLETHIYRLRQKVEKDAAIPAILVTEAGGYKLVP